MLNGKFFTGLPPKMIDRSSATGRNRMESHLFWPDDTKAETATENRLKRRNSMQLTYPEKPLFTKQNSTVDDVDTRKRFSKEFSQSSIKFYDNLNDNCRKPIPRNLLSNKKTAIAEKPTNTKLEMPDNVVNEAYTAAKKKQAYTSKIEFYDYANDREEVQKNRSKPKMDMNDKREMELNLKNSPKLQPKRDVRSLSEEKELRKINNHDIRTTKRTNRTNASDVYDQRESYGRNEENYLRSRRSAEPRTTVSPKRGLAKTSNYRAQGYSSERETYRQPPSFTYERRRPDYYENPQERDYRTESVESKFYEGDRFASTDYENFEDNYSQRRKKELPKKRREIPADRDYFYEEEDIRDKLENVHIRSAPPPRRKYSPTEELYDYDQNYHYKTPTDRGSAHQRFNYNNTQTNEAALSHNTPNRYHHNKSPINKINNQFEREQLPSLTSPPPSDAESSVSATKSQKHLRSSLCFNNGEIIGANDASISPTSSQYPAQRRNARSSATQRVSVGLPD